MTTEIIVAIALLCNMSGDSFISHVRNAQLSCQKELIKCVGPNITALPAHKLAQCVLEQNK